MAKGYLDTDLMIPDKEIDFISLKLQRKILRKRTRRCHNCGVPASFNTFAVMPIDKNHGRLKMFLSIDGVIGMQEIKCHHCEKVETITSLDRADESKFNKRLRLKDTEVEYYSQMVDHKEIIQDLLELLHIAAISDVKKRKQRHTEVTSFMLQNAKLICEEWCRPEHSDLRYSKYLVMFKETSVDSNYRPEFSSNVSEEYKEMYQMLINSFYTNRKNVELLKYLLKDTLFDTPTPAAFMMWVKIAMLHADQLEEFEALHGTIQDTHEQAYADLMESFLSVDIPVGLKKIPVVFVLFELPRFYHYCEFYKQRCEMPSRRHEVLTDTDNKILSDIELHTSILRLKRHDPIEEETKALFLLRDKFLQVLDDLSEPEKNQPVDVDKILSDQTVQSVEKETVNPDANAFLKPVVNSVGKEAMTETHTKTDDHEPNSQSSVTSQYTPNDIKEPTTQKGTHSSEDSKKSPSSNESVCTQTEPKTFPFESYEKKRLNLSDIGSSRLICVGGKLIPDLSSTPSILDHHRLEGIPTTVDQLPPEIQKIIGPIHGEISIHFGNQSMFNYTIERSHKTVPRLPQVIENHLSEAAEDKRKESEDTKEPSRQPSEGSNNSSSLCNSDETTTPVPAESHEDEASSKPTTKPRKPRSKKPHFKYGMKWKKNKMTYNVDKVTDSDSEKEEEYTYYPCKLLSEYVESQKIVETASTLLQPDVICLADYLNNQDIHHSLWNIKKKYIQNELFVILDISQDSGTCRTSLPLVSASNNRGISVPVLPILNPSSDSSALDLTIGSLYGIQVTNKLSNKQRNVFLRYVRIAVARARHPHLFENVCLGAVKYVKTNDRRVEVKLSVKDMQYEARNEEESERRKIIRLLKRAGAEQGTYLVCTNCHSLCALFMLTKIIM